MKYSYHFCCELVLATVAVSADERCYTCYEQGDWHARALLLLLSNFEQRFLAKILRNDFEI